MSESENIQVILRNKKYNFGKISVKINGKSRYFLTSTLSIV